ncbi:MAG: mucoidy inhibitor MuiA family protein [Anaerolineales bacterium]
MPELTTQIRTVVVFPNKARVTRGGKLEIEEGNHRIEITNLPLSIDPASVRARARGTARAKLSGIDVRKTFFRDTPPGRARGLLEQIRKLGDDDQSLADQAESFDRQIAHIDGLASATKTFASSLSRGRSTLEAHAELLDFVTEKRTSAQAEKRKIAIQRREITREIEKLRKEFQQIQTTRPRERYTAAIELEISGPGKLDIELTCMQSGASWKPIYDIRLAGDQLEVSYLGQVTQSTGEDWKDVTLTLSTASSTLAAVIPELKPWYISPYQPAVPRGKSVGVLAAAPAMQVARKSRAMAAGDDAEPEVQDAVVAEAEVSQKGADDLSRSSVTYKIGDGIDIPGDKSPHKTTIAIFRLPLEFDYVVAPRQAEAAFRRIKSGNDSPYMLLPGKVQLFEEDDYIGATKLDRITPGQEIELYFGVDERLRVERELVRRETDKKLIGDKRRIRYAYEIRLENHTGEAQRVLVRDQIPVPRHEELKVKLDSSTPGRITSAKISKRDDLNRIEWQLRLDDGERQTLRFGFAVEFPRGMKVIGLP